LRNSTQTFRPLMQLTWAGEITFILSYHHKK
jgi:hypothetical protein